ncbi:MAG: AtpZ/AtpI family protein [Nitrospirae bacterium]|nr:AtpZ/AtpI family protein [Nitrospirota bacterium]MCL5422402.1 AtpZ/AtpI family protein [Nitrospirota bacterium]
MPEKEPEKSLFKQLLEASSVGIQLVLSTFVGFAIGYYLDKFFTTFPWLTILFLLLGIIAGFYDLVKVARKQNGPGKKGN